MDGKRFGHLLDHRTGYATSNNHMAATVISSCLEAGILATCSLIDERMQGLALIENHLGAKVASGQNPDCWSKRFDLHLLTE